jgi:hypothetical protein
MADVLGLSDVSAKDTGKGKQLKTGNLKRGYSMAQKCKKGTIWDFEAKKCVPGKKREPPGKEGQYKFKSDEQRARELVGTGKRSGKSLSERFPKGKIGKGKKLTKKEMREIIVGPMPSPEKIKKRLKKRLKS